MTYDAAVRSTQSIFSAANRRNSAPDPVVQFPKGAVWVEELLGFASSFKEILQKWIENSPDAAIRAHEKLAQKKTRPSKKTRNIGALLEKNANNVVVHKGGGQLDGGGSDSGGYDTDEFTEEIHPLC